MNADTILSKAERSAAHLTNQADRLAHECGVLRGRIRELCDLLNTKSPHLEQFVVELDGIKYYVGASFERDDDERGDFTNIVELDIHTRSVDIYEISSKDERAIREQVIRQWEAGLKSDADELAIQRYQDAVAA